MNDPKNSNWLKFSLALQYAREGLVEFVKKSMSQFQIELLKKAGSTCNRCETCELFPCPTRGLCRRTKEGCTFHTSQPRECPVGICNELKAEIKAHHQLRRPSWVNTDARLWGSQSWELAKCFMLSGYPYTHIMTAEETDFYGIINVILNCRHFKWHSRHEKLVFQKVKDTFIKI